MYKVIIKIDACSSRNSYLIPYASYPQDMRTILFSKIVEIVKSIYPNTEKEYPDGSIYSGQGDCVYILLDSLELAVRATIDFQKKWYEYSLDYPDCRAVIDFDDLVISDATSRKEAISEALENVNLIEKLAGKGEIIVTKKVFELLKTNKAFKFREANSVEIKSRNVETYRIDYEDPRTVEEDYLVQTIFIADERSDSIRDKAIGLIILNYYESQFYP